MHRTPEDYPRRLPGTTIGSPVPNAVSTARGMGRPGRPQGCPGWLPNRCRQDCRGHPSVSVGGRQSASRRPCRRARLAARSRHDGRGHACRSSQRPPDGRLVRLPPQSEPAGGGKSGDGGDGHGDERGWMSVRGSIRWRAELQIACHPGRSARCLKISHLRPGKRGAAAPCRPAVSYLTHLLRQRAAGLSGARALAPCRARVQCRRHRHGSSIHRDRPARRSTA